MNPEQYARAREIYLEACEKQGDERGAFIREACGEDVSLREEVESLLASSDSAANFLQTPALGETFVIGSPESLFAEAGRDAADSSLRQSDPRLLEGGMPTPHRIGRYEILDVVGEGGMGVVYRAQQEMPRRVVALKVIRPGIESREALSRFDHESQVLGWLQHPGIAQIFEAGTAETEWGPRPFFAMELVDGKPIGQYAMENRLGIRERLELVARVCDAVQHAHQKGVVHRDLKPANILVTTAGQPKVLDFGVARVTDADLKATTLETATGQIIGTLAYMSPEQVAGNPADVDTRSDVYSLGVILYELLMGRVPVEVGGMPLAQAVHAMTTFEPHPLGTTHRHYRGDIEAIVAKALEKEKSERYASASDLAEDIRRYLHDQPITARPITTLYQLRKFAKRNSKLVAGVSFLMVVLVTATVISTWQAARAMRAERVAAQRLAEVEQQRSEAQRQAAIAKAVNAFLNEDLLAAASPEELGRLVTVREALDQATYTIGDRFEEQPAVEGAIRETLGVTYMSLGEFESADEQLVQAVDLHIAAQGADDPDTLDAIFELGSLRRRQGRYDEAEEILLRARDQYQRLLSPEELKQHRIISGLAELYRSQGRLEEAEKLLLETLDALRRAHGEDTALASNAANTLARLYAQQGRYEECEALLRRALDARRHVFSDDHPRALAVMGNLADVLVQQGRYDEAMPLATESLESARRVFGRGHPDTLVAVERVAGLEMKQGHYAEAEPLFVEALDARRKTLGDRHPRTFDAMTNLAMLYQRQGRTEDAEPLFLKALEAKREVLGAEHPGTLNTANNLAKLYAKDRRFDQAEPLMRQTLEARRRVLGPEHPQTLVTLNNLAALYCLEGRFEEAEPLMTEALAVQRRILGEDHPKTLIYMHNIAQLYKDLGRLEESEALHVETLERRRRTLGDQHPHTLVSINNLGILYRETGRYAEAERLFREALAARREVLGPEHPSTLASLLELAEVLADEGRYEEARPLAVDIHQQLLARFGADHRHTRQATELLARLDDQADKSTTQPAATGNGPSIDEVTTPSSQ